MLYLFISKGHVKGRGADTRKHQQQLEQMLKIADQNSDDSGYIERDEPDDAIELLGNHIVILDSTEYTPEVSRITMREMKQTMP